MLGKDDIVVCAVKKFFFFESSCLKVANVVADGSQSEFYVRVANFNQVPVSVKADSIIGTFIPMKRGI